MFPIRIRVCAETAAARLSAALLFAVVSGSVSAQPVLITAPQTINPGTASITPTGGGSPVPLGSAIITVRGTTLTVNGRHSISGLALERSLGNIPGTVTHTPGFMFDYSGAGTDVVSGLSLTVSGDVTVQGSSGTSVASSIDVSGKGFAVLTGPGAGGWNGNGSCGASGAGYGGKGGSSNCLPAPASAGGAVYGSLTAPNQLGSGGGNYGGATGARGGGAVRIIAHRVIIDGAMAANGNGNPGTSGAGSGGSVWITADSILGAGQISARGGNDSATNSSGGSGGGGRISLDTCLLDMPMNAFHVEGGTGLGAHGDPGTVFVVSTMVFNTQPANVVACPGGSAQFSVSVGGIGPFEFQWRKEGAPLVDGSGILGSGTFGLSITNVQSMDAGLYDCVVTDPCGEVESSGATLSVAPPRMCPGDADGNSPVNFADVTSVLASFGITHPSCTGPGDADGNGTVNFADVTAVLANFGATCP